MLKVDLHVSEISFSFSGVQFLEEAFVETKGVIGHVFRFHTATGILEKEKRSYYIACHLDGDVDINKLI